MPEIRRGTKLIFKDNGLRVRFNHDLIQTLQDVSFLRYYYQARASERLGREIPEEDIQVIPGIGAKFKATTTFFVGPEKGNPYPGLYRVHRDDPTALPNLAETLSRYQEIPTFKPEQKVLLNEARQSLMVVFESSDEKITLSASAD